MPLSPRVPLANQTRDSLLGCERWPNRQRRSFVNLRDAGDPVEVAKLYDEAGADELCFLDITASAEHRDTIIDVVARTAEQVFMPLTVGGE